MVAGIRVRALACILLGAVLGCGCGSVASNQQGGGTKHVNLSFVYSRTPFNAFDEMARGARSASQDIAGVTFSAMAPPQIDGAAERGLLETATKTSKDGVPYQTSTP